MPWQYHGVIEARFGSVRDQAYRDLLLHLADRGQTNVCIDIACGTGITSIWLAKHMPEIRVIGVDPNKRMLRAARTLAVNEGVSARCTFVERDARGVSLDQLPLDEPADLVVCSLGYSVIPDWQATFRNTLDLLADEGTYAIFDQFVDGLYIADFAADQSRKSWELLERSFQDAETKWYDECFLAVGTGKLSTGVDPHA